MADISSIDIKDGCTLLSLKLSREEYDFLKQATCDLMVIPAGPKFMNQPMTTGKLGNSSRLMLPKKSLDRLEVRKMRKKVPGRVFRLDGSVYLLVRLHGKTRGIPEFEGEEDE